MMDSFLFLIYLISNKVINLTRRPGGRFDYLQLKYNVKTSGQSFIIESNDLLFACSIVAPASMFLITKLVRMLSIFLMSFCSIFNSPYLMVKFI